MRTITGLAVAVALTLTAPRGLAQRPEIHVGTNVHVSAADASRPMREVHVVADSREPGRLLGCGIAESPEESRWWTVAYVSDDGGKSWRRSLDTRMQYQATIDPFCTVGVGGVLYQVATTSREEIDAVVGWRSTDFGRSWTRLATIPFGSFSMDQQSIVVDRTNGTFRGRVYIIAAANVQATAGSAYTSIVVWRSNDDGRTFQPPTVRVLPPRRGEVGISNAVMTSDGSVIMLYNEIDTETLDASKGGERNAAMMSIRASNGGATLGRTVLVDSVAMTWVPTLGSVSPRLAVDPGRGAFKDRLYAVWSDRRSGHEEILSSYSADTGRTWSRPVVISDPLVAGESGAGPFMPTVAVNQEGVVGVTWYDRRDHPDGMGWHVRFRASLDGGATWLPSVRVSSKDHDIGGHVSLYTQSFANGGGSGGYTRRAPPVAGPMTINIGVKGYNLNAGDYAGLTAAADGRFHALWIDNRTGIAQIWTAPIVVNGAPNHVAGAKPHAPASQPIAEDSLDVTAKVTLELTESRFDRATRTVSVVARLANTSSDTLRGVFIARLAASTSQIAGSARLVSGGTPATNEATVVTFVPEKNVRVLAPGARSAAKTLVFQLDSVKAIREGDALHLGLVTTPAVVWSLRR